VRQRSSFRGGRDVGQSEEEERTPRFVDKCFSEKKKILSCEEREKKKTGEGD